MADKIINEYVKIDKHPTRADVVIIHNTLKDGSVVDNVVNVGDFKKDLIKLQKIKKPTQKEIDEMIANNDIPAPQHHPYYMKDEAIEQLQKTIEYYEVR